MRTCSWAPINFFPHFKLRCSEPGQPPEWADLHILHRGIAAKGEKERRSRETSVAYCDKVLATDVGGRGLKIVEVGAQIDTALSNGFEKGRKRRREHDENIHDHPCVEHVC
ncbi:hypothetical protein R1flu_017719 [Riccia fluitans]|uniref:Uncharacterized protein n=1 Tax=Riccia fluitans TaxID=41844 RepID=A0ABD1ZDS4_9MARC